MNKYSLLNVTANGLITTRDHHGLSIVQVDEMEDDVLVDRIQFPVKVKNARVF